MTDNIASALCAAQLQMTNAAKESDNPHFRSKYADLASVMNACMTALNKNGISVIQPFVETETSKAVCTKFLHPSGETLECSIPIILGKQDMQGLGSAITYARRYGLMSLAGIAPDDDDGNAAASTGQRQLSWVETIIAEMKPDATDKEKAEEIARALKASWGRKNTETQLKNEWDRRSKIINHIMEKFPDIHTQIVDDFENRMIAIGDKETEAA